MERFFGMMPMCEVDIIRRYRDRDGLRITIQSGKHGWTIIWADGGTNYKDVEATAEDNFKEAYDVMIAHIPEVKEVYEHCFDVAERGTEVKL